MTARRLLLGAAAMALFGGSAAAATTVYRCGNAYADVPCPRSTIVDVDDPRSDADRAAARDVARREAALAASLAADRPRTDPPRNAARPARAASAPAPRHRLPRRSRHEDDEGNFVAFVPAPKHAKH